MSRADADRKRPYRMKARATAAAATVDRILDATMEALSTRGEEQITLGSIAQSAGVSVQTILERFQNKPRLFEAAIARLGTRIIDQRSAVAVGDLDGAARNLVEHYEEVGDRVLQLLSEERRHPKVVGALAGMGRTYHRQWCERIFESALVGLEGVERERRVAQLVTVTDVYAWKLMRIDRGLSARQTEIAMRELIEALIGAPG